MCSLWSFAQNGLPSPPKGGASSLLFPSVIDNIFNGEFKEVPDDQLFRSYIVSVFKGMKDACNQQEVGMVAGIYGFPKMRQFNETGNVGSAGNIFIAMGEMTVSKNPLDAVSTLDVGPKYFTYGYEDGQAMVATYKCNSIAVRGLMVEMEKLFNQRSYAPKEHNDGKRWTDLMDKQWRAIIGDIIPVSEDINSGRLSMALDLSATIKNHKNKKSYHLNVASQGLTTTITVNKGDILEISASGYIKVGMFAGSSTPVGMNGLTEYNRIKSFKHGSLLVKTGRSNWSNTGNHTHF